MPPLFRFGLVLRCAQNGAIAQGNVWGTLPNARKSHCATAPSRAHDYDHLEGMYPYVQGRAGGHRLLHRRGVDLVWVGDVLRLVLRPPG